MTIKVLSDTALLIEVAETAGSETLTKVRVVAERLSAMNTTDFREVVPGLTAVAVHLDPAADVEQWLVGLAETFGQGTARLAGASLEGRQRVIPVVYGGEFGPDLSRVAGQVGLSREEIIRRHTDATYEVMALGFAPGFPYLDGLDPALACPRLDTPRLRVPAGAVGIGGAQTGVYPQVLPGGWNLIGRTAQRLFDPEAREPAWLRVGDQVRFERVEAWEEAVAPSEADPVPSSGPRWVEVSDGGVQTTVQDGGRLGFQAIGVAEGGAMDRGALEVANLMVGNPAAAAGLEFVLKGPILRFSERTLVAIAGAAIDGRLMGRPFWVEAGEELDLRRPQRGARGYLAIGGGLDLPQKMNSASTHLAAGFGGWAGRALRPGDRLPVGAGSAVELQPGWGISRLSLGIAMEQVTEIRVVRGPESDWFDDEAWRSFTGEDYQLTADSNRMGCRLEGPAIAPIERKEMISQPVAWGTIQIPPGGQPVVLMADRQSVGGYPRIGAVIAADRGRLAQVPLGGTVRLVECSLGEARAARRRQQRDRGLLEAGLRGRLFRET